RFLRRATGKPRPAKPARQARYARPGREAFAIGAAPRRASPACRAGFAGRSTPVARVGGLARSGPCPPRRVSPVVLPAFILGGHPEALQGIGLGAESVLPADVDLQVAEGLVGVEVEGLGVDALVRARMAHQDVGLEPVRGGALLAVIDDLR